MSISVAVVTGGSRGIGLATARQLASQGYALVLAARSRDPLEAAAAQLREAGVACESVAVDVGSPAGAGEVIDAALRRFGRLDVLVNNAGVAPVAKLDAVTDDAFSGCVSTNVAAVFYTTRAAWPAMRAQGSGVIVNVSSVASVDPFPGFSVYGACKAWVNAFTKAVAAEGRPLGIRAYSVAPGAVETSMLRSAFPDFPAKQTLAPEQVAAVISRLCDPAFSPASGETVFVRK